MKRTVHKANETPAEMSPITPKGQVVFSTIKEFSDPANPRDRYIEEFTPDAEDAVRVLRFLDEMNGIGWTPQLKDIEKKLREALLDLMAVHKQ